MLLTNDKISVLDHAIQSYNFPPIFYNFKSQQVVIAKDMSVLENVIYGLLTSNVVEEVEFGLANVIYWGNANAGYKMHRVKDFREKISIGQISEFIEILKKNSPPSIADIRRLKLPQFSGISFISKIIAFIDPKSHCVLDLLLSRLGQKGGGKAIDSLKVTTSIGTTMSNIVAYENWCRECVGISELYFNNIYRAVDIERGFFYLVQNDKIQVAREIYRNC